ncbi:hypothetical protein CALCODRAFT_184104 [Calocera cornea HHB12733]|uniref:Uncharacterized protein n=1 Tax=Calocera cornea HHB12733 TaxID=1353952 RepID=A0A165CAF2_9BASI|nr:hypothetical protein CALCODRAFT_184104 [Calocera cornea HHB12733]
MPFLEVLPVNRPTSGSPRSDSPGQLMKSVLVNPDFLEPIEIAVDDDAKYKPLYDEYTRDGKVHPVADENGLLSMMGYRLRNGGPGGPARNADYHDRHVSICSTSCTLTIKHWLIAHPTLVIGLEKVVYIRPARDVVPNAGVEAWGVGRSGVGWARDRDRAAPTGRAFQHSYICKFTEWGDEFSAGFTVDHPEEFIRQIEKLAPGITTAPVDEEVGEMKA